MRAPAAVGRWSIASTKRRVLLPRHSHLFQHLGAVKDVVAVTLLCEKQLPVVGEVQLAGVAGYQRVEMGYLAVHLGAEDAAQALGFFLPRAEGSRHLNQHVGIGQIEGKIANFGQNQVLQLAASELAVEIFSLGTRRLASNERHVEALSQNPK